jgi:chemotaxis protein CheX
MNEMNMEPLIKASAHVFEQFQIACRAQDCAYQSEYDESDILTIIGITGDIRGQVMMRMPEAVGLDIASAMMGGAGIDQLDQMAQSALLELCNMICGNALTAYTEKGMSLNITPPTLVFGRSIGVSGAEVHTLRSTLLVNETDTVELSIMFEGK